MESSTAPQKYVGLLRGINVGGHHKVPMADLRIAFEEMGYAQIKTLLNSGNVIFNGPDEQIALLESRIASHLENVYGFSIPVLIRKADDIQEIISNNPFKNILVTKDIRLYVTFLKESPKEAPRLPRISTDGSFQIIEVKGSEVYSVLDVSIVKTTDAMNILEKSYSKDITTRNWNTVEKIGSIINGKDIQ